MVESEAAHTVRQVHKLDGTTVIERVPLQEQGDGMHVSAAPATAEDKGAYDGFSPVERITIKLDGTRIVEQLDEKGHVISTSVGGADGATAKAPPAPEEASPAPAPSADEQLRKALTATWETVRAAGGRAAEMRRAAKAMGAPRPKVVVLTGGAGAGKTALAGSLGERGCKVVPQAASAVIEAVSRLVGPEEQAVWREAFAPAFGYLVGRVALSGASLAPADADGVTEVCDSSLLDGIAYALRTASPLPAYLGVEEIAAAAARITHVFVLEQVASERVVVPGQDSRMADSMDVSSILFSTYAELGCNTRWLPVAASQDERAQQVMDACGSSYDLD